MGFASASGFSHAFRRATGATPRQVRQRVLRGAR
jgi:AraC-like DNA-binding protein